MLARDFLFLSYSLYFERIWNQNTYVIIMLSLLSVEGRINIEFYTIKVTEIVRRKKKVWHQERTPYSYLLFYHYSISSYPTQTSVSIKKSTSELNLNRSAPSNSEIQEEIINHCIVELGWQRVSLYCGFVDRDHVWTSAAVFWLFDVGSCFFRMLFMLVDWFCDIRGVL